MEPGQSGDASWTGSAGAGTGQDLAQAGGIVVQAQEASWSGRRRRQPAGGVTQAGGITVCRGAVLGTTVGALARERIGNRYNGLRPAADAEQRMDRVES